MLETCRKAGRTGRAGKVRVRAWSESWSEETGHGVENQGSWISDELLNTTVYSAMRPSIFRGPSPDSVQCYLDEDEVITGGAGS